MQTLGSTIKEIRESKKLSTRDIAVKTNIILEYIEAIERDDFSILPAEVYVKGFLRNIAHVLEVDSSKILQLYKNRNTEINAIESAKLLEEYTKPIEATEDEKAGKLKNINKKTKKKNPDVETSEVSTTKIKLEYSKREQELLLDASSKPRNIKRARQIRFIFICFLALLLIVSLVVFLAKKNVINIFSENDIETENNAKINIVDSYAKVGVKKGDTVYFKPVSATLEFTKVDGNVEAILNGLDVSFSKNTPFLADVNKNGIDDFRLQLIDVVDNVAMIEIEEIDEIENNTDSTSTIFNNTSRLADSNIETALDSNVQIIDGDMYIFRNVEQSSILVEATAKRFVYVRYFVDNLKPITTNLSSGNSISIEADEVIMLTIGNASEIVLKINGKSVMFGNAGETINKTIKWIKNLDNSTKFDLVVTDTK